MHLSPVKLSHLKATAVIFATALASLAWFPSTSPAGHQPGPNRIDTIPGQQLNQNADDSRLKGIDERLQQLEKAMQQLEKQLQQKDWDKMQRQLEASLSKIDMEKIQQQLETSLQKINMDKLKMEADAAMKKVDMDKIRQEIQSAMAEVKDKEKWKELDGEYKEAMKQAKKSIEEVKKIDFAKIQKEMQKAQAELQKERVNIDKSLQKAREEMKNNKSRIQDELAKAKLDIGKAKDELQGYKKMIGDMETDGLLNTKADYSIEYKGDELFIDGKKQSRQVTDKYKAYFKKGNTSIRQVKGNFSINSDVK